MTVSVKNNVNAGITTHNQKECSNGVFVDEQISNVLELMWGKGYATSYSCQGYSQSNNCIPRQGYISFVESSSIAANVIHLIKNNSQFTISQAIVLIKEELPDGMIDMNEYIIFENDSKEDISHPINIELWNKAGDKQAESKLVIRFNNEDISLLEEMFS